MPLPQVSDNIGQKKTTLYNALFDLIIERQDMLDCAP